jgi:hypothetical protein
VGEPPGDGRVSALSHAKALSLAKEASFRGPLPMTKYRSISCDEIKIEDASDVKLADIPQ